jgi:hypothetical protein
MVWRFFIMVCMDTFACASGLYGHKLEARAKGLWTTDHSPGATPPYVPPSFAKDAVEGRQQRLIDVGGEREFANRLMQ